jgi:hypothetical protein
MAGRPGESGGGGRPAAGTLCTVLGSAGSLTAISSTTVSVPANTGLVRIEAAEEAPGNGNVLRAVVAALCVSTRVRVTERGAPAGLVDTSASAPPSADLTGARSSPVTTFDAGLEPAAGGRRSSSPGWVSGPVVP